MKYISLGLAVVSLITGLVSAWFWLLSSQVEIDPGWVVQPGEFEATQAGWTGALIGAGLKSARLNKKAAVLAAISVATGSLSNFISSAG